MYFSAGTVTIVYPKNKTGQSRMISRAIRVRHRVGLLREQRAGSGGTHLFYRVSEMCSKRIHYSISRVFHLKF